MYEQWFAGIERIEPARERDAFDKLMRTLQQDRPNNTASRFRHQQLTQRYATYTTYWRRIARQIEEGTYKRDIAKARKNKQRREQESSPRGGAFELDVEVELDFDQLMEDAATSQEAPPEPTNDTAPPHQSISKGPPKKAVPPRPPTSKAPVPPPMTPPLKPTGQRPRPPASAQGTAGTGPSQLSDRQVKAIYDRYIAARKDNSERVDNVKLATLTRSVRTMMPKLARKHGGKTIDFEVVVRDGKVALKPVAK